jgi:hypothetical protein
MRGISGLGTMMRRLCHLLVIALMLAGAPAAPLRAAIAPEERVFRSVREQGYRIIYRERTWLGRIRILAVKGDYLREVVIGPGTGEVLRDLVVEVPGLAAALASAKGGVTIGGVEVPAQTGNSESDGQDSPSVGTNDTRPAAGVSASPPMPQAGD